MAYLKIIIYLLLIFNFTPGWCEGSKQVEPGLNDTTKLTIGSETTQNFATFSSVDSTQKIYIHISDFSKEKIHLGFGRAFGSSALEGPRSYDRSYVSTVYFRISRPDKSILVSPQLVPVIGAGYIPNKQTLLNGVNGLNGVSNGYTTLDFLPDMNGDYSIEFSFTPLPNNFRITSFRFELFDFTVSNTTTKKSIAGRLWAYKWQFNNIINRNPANGKFYTYTRDSVVTSFELNGMRPHGYTVMCNKYGKKPRVGVPIDYTQTRKSIIVGSETSQNPAYPEYKVFLSDPDSLAYPSYKEPLRIKSLIKYQACKVVNSECQGISIEVNKEVFAEIWIDINGNNIKDNQDTTLTQMLTPGMNCIPWDSKDKFGKPIAPGTKVNVNAAMNSGITNFPVFDPEGNDNGIIVKLIRPKYQANDDIKVYWDDSQMRSRRMNFPYTNLDGCYPSGGTGCHRWPFNNYVDGFGDKALMNTFWYGFTSKDIKSFTVPELPIANAGSFPVLCKKKLVQLGNLPQPNTSYTWKGIKGTSAAYLSNSSIANPSVDLTSIATLKVNDTLWFRVEAEIAGCKDIDTVRLVYKTDVKPAIVSGPTKICPGNQKLVVRTPSIGDGYKWTISGDPSFLINKSIQYDSLIIEINAQEKESFKISMETTPSNGCPGDTGSLIIRVVDLPIYPKPTGEDHICFEMDTVEYNITPMTQVGIKWRAKEGDIIGKDNEFTVKVRWEKGSNNWLLYQTTDTIILPNNDKRICRRNSDSLNVIYRAIKLLQAPPDTTICLGEQINLSLIKGQNQNVQWSPITSTADNIVDRPTITTQYIVKLQDEKCISGDTVNVTVANIPSNPIDARNLQVCFEDGDEFTISATPGMSSYSWQPYNLSTNEELKLSKSIFDDDFQEKNIYVTVRSVNGCTVKDSILVKAICPPRLFVPKIFTPNMDADNDSLEIFGAHFKNFELTIFNRWGEVIFKTKDRNERWDGTYKGESMVQGVYPWNIRYDSLFENDIQNPRIQTGSITIVK